MRGRAVAVVGLLVAATIGPAATAAVAATDIGQPTAGPAAATSGGYPVEEQPDADNTVTRIAVHPNGSATWTIKVRTRLTTDDDLAEYRRFQESFRENSSRYLDPFRTRMSGVVANADVDRDTRATDFDARTTVQEVPRRWGVVTYEFTWHGFAAVDGDEVVVGDAFAGGFYIGEGDVLEIAVPDGYAVATAEPTPDEVDDGVAEWVGREDFPDGQPRLVAEPTAGGAPSGRDDENDRSSPVLLGVGLLIVASVAAFGIARRRGNDGPVRERAATAFGELVPGSDGDEATGEGDVAAEEPAPDGARRDEPDPAADCSDAADGAETPPDESDASPDGADEAAGGSDATDEPLLTDEDRVRNLLRDRSGRVKQRDVADEFDWSTSKTSRVLSRMADEDEIRKLRIGRENVIELPDGDR